MKRKIRLERSKTYGHHRRGSKIFIQNHCNLAKSEIFKTVFLPRKPCYSEDSSTNVCIQCHRSSIPISITSVFSKGEPSTIAILLLYRIRPHIYPLLCKLKTQQTVNVHGVEGTPPHLRPHVTRKISGLIEDSWLFGAVDQIVAHVLQAVLNKTENVRNITPRKECFNVFFSFLYTSAAAMTYF